MRGRVKEREKEIKEGRSLSDMKEWRKYKEGKVRMQNTNRYRKSSLQNCHITT